MKNKKGQIELVWLFVILLAVLVLGFVFSLVIGIVHWGTETISPIASDLGVVEGYNVSQAGEMTFGTVNTLVGLMPLLIGMGYIILLVGCIALVLSYRGTQNPIFIGLFFAFLIVLVLVAILVSNAFQDLHEGDDEIALELQSQTVLSFLILQSPMIFGIVGFICGIFLISGKREEQVYGGGY